MTPLDLRAFSQVWVVDAEFRQGAGERPEVHCLVASELWSGQTLRLWRDELLRLARPPHPVGAGVLFVSYNALAEFSCYLALGWPLPIRVVDLLIEFRLLTNGTAWREGEKSRHRLIQATQYFGMSPMDAADKSEMQTLAIRGGPFVESEQRELMAYCERDVVATTELLRRMAPKLSLQALQRGRFTRSTPVWLVDWRQSKAFPCWLISMMPC